MQMEGWKKKRDQYYYTYNNSPMGCLYPASVVAFAAYLLGLGSDHAEDQKKLACMLEEWKKISDWALRGEKHMQTLALVELLPIIAEESACKVDAVGGPNAWEALPESDKDKWDHAAYDRLCSRFGEEAWAKLSDHEHREAQLFVMSKFWEKAGLTGPTKLMNKDNAAAANAGPSAACDRALDVLTGGAIHLTTLACILFNHKDDKKGQQDSFRIFFELCLGYMICFPDTSNTRFQSHYMAAAALILHLPYYLEFLLMVHDKKENRSFNHMEQNVFEGLKDLPTLTKLCVLTLYSQAISHPYMRIVCGSGNRRINAIELGPLHKHVTEHCRLILGNPDLLLAPDFNHKTGALDGMVWERAEVLYAVQQLAPSLPHLKECLVSFFVGALETWERFCSEFEEGGIISELSAAEKGRAWIQPTNDHNEGALGSLRQTWRRALSMTIAQHNACTMYKQNDTCGFIQSGVLNAADMKYICKEAQRVDSSGQEKQMCTEQAEHDQQAVEDNRKKMPLRRRKQMPRKQS